MPTLQFKGKSIIWNHHLSVPYHALESVPELDFQPEKAEGHGPRGLAPSGNLIIEGDNLLALKALLPIYGAKVKCIYIDPPYNTGNEGWVYNDNANSPLLRDWLGKEVGRDDLTRHDKWLCMMTPRLKLLRELLSEDGVIFISIDDNEVHHLRAVMNEIFGEENFMASIVWQKVYSPRMDAKGFSEDHDYILVYRRSGESVIGRIFFEQNLEQFSSVDKAAGKQYRPRSLRKEGKNSRRVDRPNLFYPLIAPDGTEVFPIRADGSEGRWRWAIKKYEEEQSKGLVEWVNTENGWQVYAKQFLNEEATRPPGTIWFHNEVGHNHQAADELKNIFGKLVFDSPKPTGLIKRMLEIATDEEDVILDSFAGSGTTAHAVLDFNKVDSSSRKFILVQMTEATPAEPEKNICKDITRERVKRAIEKFSYESGFAYQRVGPAMDAEALLAGQLPEAEQFGRYVFYLCTGEQSAAPLKALDDHLYLVGESGEAGPSTSLRASVYLLYSQDYETLTRLALNLEAAEIITAGGEKKRRIVYAPACFLDEEYLRAQNIEFVGIPYGLFQRKGGEG